MKNINEPTDPFILQGLKNLKRAAKENRRALFSPYKYDLLVFIGRFQPMHKGHEKVINKALSLAKEVLLIVGSAGKSRSIRNPFTFDERKEMINSVYPTVAVEAISDATYNDNQWTLDVQRIVSEHTLKIINPDGFRNNGLADAKIGLIGFEKDHSSYYLKLFPQWYNEGVDTLDIMNATDIRKMWFEDEFLNKDAWNDILSDNVANYIINFDRQIFAKLVAEYDYIQGYKKTWGYGPFLTCDSLVQVGGNILLIKRGREYGSGLYALPGGFLGQNEKFFEGAVRELKEETRLKVPVPVLKGSLVSHSVFDDPHRSERGRIITMCYHFKLENELELPEVRGSDDADWAGFVDFSTLTEQDFFEDHYHIIKKMMGI